MIFLYENISLMSGLMYDRHIMIPIYVKPVLIINLIFGSISKFFKRAFRFGYTNNLYVMAEVIRNRDSNLWNTIIDTVTPSHPLYQLLPPKKQRFLRKRGHDFILPVVKTERFKRSFINRCLFNFI